MAWDVEYTDEFGEWWDTLGPDEQDAVDTVVGLLADRGPALGFPFSSGIQGSRHSHMRELRIQHKSEPYRVLYAFNPLRTAILLCGGKKTGDDRWYDRFVPIADKLYDEHLQELEAEGENDG